jgi:hypothetical protein
VGEVELGCGLVRRRERGDSVEVTRDLSYGEVVGAVVEAVPELREALAEHVRDNDEVLQHVFFGCDLVPFVLAAWKAGDAELVGRCLEVLEAAMVSPDPRTRELV